MATGVPPAGEELLDDLAAPPAAIRTSLRNISRANRWFGGAAAVQHGVARLLGSERPSRLSLLDIGTGLGDVPRAIAEWLSRDGTTVAAIGIERHPVAARAATEEGLATILADGCRLPLPDRRIDLVVISQVAHHLPPAAVVTLAAEATRVARRGVVLADLRPSRPAAWGFRLASRVLGFDDATRIDGVRSLARGFTVGALAGLLRSAGVDATVVTRPGARIVAYWKADR